MYLPEHEGSMKALEPALGGRKVIVAQSPFPPEADARVEQKPGTNYRIFRMARSGRPVLATPAGSLDVRLAGLVRFQPFTPRRAMYRRVMQWLMRLGLDHWFSEDAPWPIDPSTGFDFNHWLEQARAEIGHPEAVAAVIWPIEAGRRRLYVHLFDTAINPVGFAKISLNEEHDRRLEHEASVLRTLDGMHLKCARVPRLLTMNTWQGHRYLIMEPVPRDAAPLPVSLDSFPRAASEEIAGPARFVPGDRLAGLSWWSRYERRLDAACAPFDRELRSLAAGGVHVRRAHGDFGLNNIVIVGGLPWIFDWEECHDDAPARTDEVVFWLTTNIRSILARPRTMLRKFADRYLRGATLEERRDVMLVLAFRLSRGMPTAGKLVRLWSHATGVNE